MPYIGNTAADRFVASKAATQFSGDGSTTAFTLEHSVGADEDILVSVDGVVQEPSVAYAVSSGTTLTFTAAPSSNSGNNIFVYYLFRTVATVDHPSTSALTATSGTFSSTLDVTGETTLATHLNMGDNDIIKVGAGTDLQIYHDGTYSRIMESGGTGLVLDTTSTDIRLTASNSEVMGKFIKDGAVELYHNNNKKFETTSSGVSATGNIVGSGQISLSGGTASSGDFTDGGIHFHDSSTSEDAVMPISFTPSATGNRARAAIGFISQQSGGTDGFAGAIGFYTRDAADGSALGTSDEKVRIDKSGNLLVGSSNSSSDEVGARLKAGGRGDFTVSGGSCSIMNRKASDGTILFLQQENSTEGSISVSGTTVSYNGGHLSRWSRLLNNSKDETIVKGTVMTNLDEMVEWKHEKELWTKDDELPDGVSVGDVKKDAYTEDNEQLNKMAVSSVEGDVNVAGVFVNWDNDDDFNDMNVAMTGDMVIRIAKDTTVSRGDLLMSAGDGTAKPQGDDIVRSKTIAKVTSTNVSHTYDDGTYLVPCVLMAC
jgi:hypothetical protein